MSRLEEKVVIITGAASGMGKAAAHLFHQHGARVVVADRHFDGADATARTMADRGMSAALDVTSQDDWTRVVEATLSRFGKIDALANFAGVYIPKSFQDTDRALLDLHYEVNVVGTYLGMASVCQEMPRGGAIVNVASGAALRPSPGIFAYAASKWMVRGMTKSAAVELAPLGIRVNGIFPGLIDTPMLAGNSPEYVKALTAFIPFGRLGEANEVANTALFLVSDESSYLTGTEISVCGGLGA